MKFKRTQDLTHTGELITVLRQWNGNNWFIAQGKNWSCINTLYKEFDSYSAATAYFETIKK